MISSFTKGGSYERTTNKTGYYFNRTLQKTSANHKRYGGHPFYPNRYIAQRRLNTIHQLRQLKRTERIVVNQPYIYYLDKRDIRHLPFTKLLYDLRQNEYDISEYDFDGRTLTAIIHKDELSYKINSTIQNIEQVYKRLSLIA